MLYSRGSDGLDYRELFHPSMRGKTLAISISDMVAGEDVLFRLKSHHPSYTYGRWPAVRSSSRYTFYDSISPAAP